MTSMHSLDEDARCLVLERYLHDLRNRPKDNNIEFWRNFVSEYYATCAKERWCFSKYTNLGQMTINELTHGITETLRCESCESSSMKGFESCFEILPRLWKIKFDTGTIDEILHLESPKECKYSSGNFLLKYDRAIQQSIHDTFRVIREGKLRVTFRNDLKILLWEFCVTNHEEYMIIQAIQPQVNELLDAAYRCEEVFNDRATNEDAKEDIQEHCNLFQKAGQELSKTMQLPIVNDVGFSMQHVRSLRFGEVVDMMKDVITFSIDRKTGPIESLQNYVKETKESVLKEEESTHGRDTGTEGYSSDTSSTGNMI